MIPLVAASEEGTRQTESPAKVGRDVVKNKTWDSELNFLERKTSEGDSPVNETIMVVLRGVGCPGLGV